MKPGVGNSGAARGRLLGGRRQRRAAALLGGEQRTGGERREERRSRLAIANGKQGSSNTS